MVFGKRNVPYEDYEKAMRDMFDLHAAEDVVDNDVTASPGRTWLTLLEEGQQQ